MTQKSPQNIVFTLWLDTWKIIQEQGFFMAPTIDGHQSRVDLIHYDTVTEIVGGQEAHIRLTYNPVNGGEPLLSLMPPAFDEGS